MGYQPMLVLYHGLVAHAMCIISRVTDASGIVRLIKAKAISLGFDLCGIARAEPSAYRDYYLNWIKTHQHGRMHYMADRADERLDPRTYFPAAKSVVCVAMNYHVSESTTPSPGTPGEGGGEGPRQTLTPALSHEYMGEGDQTRAQIAKYARGVDYHTHIKDRLFDLADWIRDTFPGAQTKVGVDTVPILERELAVRAGIGWQGKNTCVISPKIGSWIFLAEVLTSLDLPPDEPETDHCGTCTRCIDACPTAAITAPYQLDATRCISYLTIEHDGPIDESLKSKMDGWLFGCDICQDVCPFNGRAPTALDPFLQPRVPATVDARAVAEWTLEEYHTFTRRTAMRRVKLPLFQRNARIALENAE